MYHHTQVTSASRDRDYTLLYLVARRINLKVVVLDFMSKKEEGEM